MNIFPVTLVAAFISEHYGRATSELFQDTFQGERKFSDCPHSALNEIKECVYDLINSSLLVEDIENELRQYLHDLEEYMFHGIG